MEGLTKEGLTDFVKEQAYSAGFDHVGIAPSGHLAGNEQVLREWVASGMNDGMTYMARDTRKRSDPAMLLNGAKSVIITALSYYNPYSSDPLTAPVISRYAYGRDYHTVIKEKLELVTSAIIEKVPTASFKSFVDSAPVLEKPWAVLAGLGWQGKHSIVINPGSGSFFFLGGIITDLELIYDSTSDGDRCGDCRICIESCPTSAINENRTINANRCIASLTIENRGEIPEDFIPMLGGRLYGCDLCQEVCPWNRAASHHNHPEFEPAAKIREMKWSDWMELSDNEFNELFAQSPILRVKYGRFRQNILAAHKSAGTR